MNDKMKDCFTPHVMMHSLLGLGLGIVLLHFVPSLQNLWLGVGLIVVAMVLDMTRK